MRRYWGEIKDPVHGYVYITEAEKEVIDSFPVQRLHRLRQLAGAEYVYPGANHTRFEHSIGVMHLAGLLAENPHLSQLLSEDEAQKVRIAALLHDVGHGPFSHVFEHLLVKFLNKTHEDINVWIVQKSELKDILKGLGYDPDELAKLSVGLLHKPGRAFMDQVIRSAVDVDKLDFVVRDTYHTGAEYGYVDIFRLIHMLDVLDENLAVDLGALSALESFILARIESFKSIYFHRVGRAVQIMLATAMEEAKDELDLVDFRSPEDYLALDDYTVWTMLKGCKKSKGIIENLERRKLLKCAYDKTFYVRDKTVSSIFSVEEIRNQMRDKIASEAGVKPKSVVIDVPTLPSVPYRHSVLLEPMEIPVFHRTRDGEKIPQRLSDISGIFDVLKGFINILRVYTEEKHRERVGAAATKLLGGLPSSAKISF
ncbi:MAG: HD domain-containing protein [Candidatus Bathyarchaeota archaeon]|nr:HD domain-containing protein [Candidatus Bathyarchaeota archaeon]MDH5713895.1 HD domain-containing protein [Candidatus Bathyarchaeota archaeon]